MSLQALLTRALGSMYSDGTQAINAAATVMEIRHRRHRECWTGMDLILHIQFSMELIILQRTSCPHATGYANISNILTQNFKHY